MIKLQRSKKPISKKLLKVRKSLPTKKTIKKTDPLNKGRKARYSEMTVDDFLDENFSESSAESEDNEQVEESIDQDNDSKELIDDEPNYDDVESRDSNSEEIDSGDEILGHKESLAKLKKTDPEFYKFLQENDKKLLDFHLSDDSDSDVKDEDDKFHKTSEGLEVASDESDFEDDEKHVDSAVITLKMLKSWQDEIQKDTSNTTIVKLMKAFHAAILRISNNEEDEISNYKVDGSSVFNGVIQICVLELGPALRRYLRIPPRSKQPPHKSKKFVKIKAALRGYFVDMLKLLNGVTSTNILTVLLKHLHYLSPLVVSYSNVVKQLLKKLVHLWGTGDETVRVIAFLCIVRMINNQQQNNLDMVLKSMYMTYVQNAKFVSPSTLPMINFMRRSLVEMYSIDVNVSYQHVFLYIRQLAIHLRNAITVKKKENIQAVYNWQFINSLKLWGNLLSVTNEKSQLHPLIYPFVQVCLGTINLVPIVQYYPLRFHITETLIEFSNATSVFIAILPYLLEILTSYNFNKKHQKVSMKPLQFLYVLRMSKSQLVENSFKDAVIDAIYGQTLEYLAHHSYSIAFPDLSLFCIVQIKMFLKKCSVAAYCRKMRQLLEKIEQNNKFILAERKNVSFTLSDSKQIEAWQMTLKSKGTPLLTYYESWKTMKNVKKNKEATNNEVIGDYNLPVLKKGKQFETKTNNVDKKTNEKVVLFPSDSESEDERGKNNEKVVLFPSDSESENESLLAEDNTKSRPKRGKRGGKNATKKQITVTVDEDDYGDDNLMDVVEDLKVSDW